MAAFKATPSVTWVSQSTPARAVLLCLHGLGLHAGAFTSFGESISKFGIATYSLDMRGFGRWQTERKDTLNFPQCRQDVKETLQYLKEQHPQLPIFILGESLGGAIASTVAADNPSLVDGIILSAPARIVFDHKVEALQVACHALTSWGKPICISETVFRYTPHVVAWQAEDPLIRLEYSLTELLHLATFLLHSFNSIKRLHNIPVLMVQGHTDQLITTQSTFQFFERIPGEDKQLVVLGKEGHLLFQTPKVAKGVVALVRDWIADHVDNVVALPDHPRKQAG